MRGELLSIKQNDDGSLDMVIKAEDGQTYTAKGCKLRTDTPDANGLVFEDVATMLAQKEHEQAERWAGHHLYKELKWDASKSPFANLKEL